MKKPDPLGSDHAIKILDDDEDENIGADFNSIGDKRLSVTGSQLMQQSESVIEQQDFEEATVAEDDEEKEEKVAESVHGMSE